MSAMVVSTFYSLLLLLPSFLTAGPLFVLANLIILAILVSSGSFTIPHFSHSIHPPLRLRLFQLLASRLQQFRPLLAHFPDPLPAPLHKLPSLPATPQRLTTDSAIASQLRHGDQLAIEESKQALASSAPFEVLLRSQSDQLKRTATLRQSDPRGAKTVHTVSVFPKAHRENSSSPMIGSPALNDDDFQRKCEEFIAKFRANMKKEALN